MGVCRSERVRPRLAALALAGLLVGQTLIPCGMLLSSVHAAELRVSKSKQPSGIQPRNLGIPAWAKDLEKRAAQQQRERKTRLAQWERPGKNENNGDGAETEDSDCLDCEVDLNPLDLSDVPTEKALRRAGGVDGALYPMRRAEPRELGIKLDRLLKRVGVEGGLRGQLPAKDPRFAALKRAQRRYERARAINTLFGSAVVKWKKGEREAATALFGQYMKEYPKTPWSGEALLHLGYEAKSGGRLAEAVETFQTIEDKTSEKPNEKLRAKKRERKKRGVDATEAERDADVDEAMANGASVEDAVGKLDSSEASDDDDESFEIHMKAKQQLADIDMAMGHFGDAADKMRQIMKEDTDWHRRVWARNQLQRSNILKHSGALQMACGPQSLRMVMVGLHKNAAAKKMESAVAPRVQGFSMVELQRLAAKNGVAMRGFRSDVSELSHLALPAILHYDFGRDSTANSKASGHFVVLQGVDGKGRNVRLFDPLNKKSSRLSYAQLKREWSGQGLALAKPDVSPIGVGLSNGAMKAAIGSSTTFASTHDVGDVANNSSVGVGDGMNAPEVTVNQASLNLYINHTVTSYQPLRGPSAAITLSYNSDSDGTVEVFGVTGTGRKWTTNFSSYSFLNYQEATVNTTGSLIEIQMPDGSQDLYHWDQATNRYIGEPGNFKWIGRFDFYSNSNGYSYQYRLNFLDGTSWAYNGDTNSAVLSEVSDAQGYATYIYYNTGYVNSTKDIQEIRDADGRSTTFTYTTAGSLSNSSRSAIKTITDPFNRKTTFSYDDNTGDLIGVTDSQGRSFKYTYDTQFSDLKTIEVPAINNTVPVWRFNRDGAKFYTTDNKFKESRMTITDPNNGIQERYYEPNTGKTFYVAPQNYVPAPNTYSSATRITQYQFTLSPDGERVPQVISLPDGTAIGYGYETQHGLVNRITDRQGKGTYFTYNSMGQALTAKDPNGNITTTAYAANGLDPISVTRPNPNVPDPNSANAYTQVMSATYNTRPHMPDTISDVGGTTTITYTDWGAPNTTEDPQGRQTRNVYNVLGQVDRVERSDKPVGSNPRVWVIVQKFTYDGFLRVKDSFDAANLKTSFQYNSHDKVTFTTFPDNSTEQNIYRTGNDDILVGVKDRVGRNSWIAYDDLGRTTILQDVSNNYSYLSYDKDDNLKQLNDNKGNVTQWDYDALDRAIGKRYHDGTTESYAYGYGNYAQPNGRGNLVQTTGTRGQIVKYEYDDNGNQTKIDYPNMADVTLSYNRLDDAARVNDGIGSHVMGYDNFGRLISNDGPLVADTQTYTYDDLQRIKTQTVENGANGGAHNQTYAYDALGRLASLNASDTGLTTYSYDGNTDRLRLLTHPNGTKSDLRYDAIGRLQHVFNGANGDAFYNRYSSNYDARDVKINTQSRTGSSNPFATTQYTYDALDQLKQERVTGGVAGTAYTNNYGYDAMGNRVQHDRVNTDANGSSSVVSTLSTPNALNQLTDLTTRFVATGQVTSANLTYDAAGNLTRSANNDGTSTVYFYDDADRLNRIERRNTNDAPIQVSDFVYDYASRRALTREYVHQGGTTWLGPVITYRVFDGMDVIQERHANNYLTAQLVRDGNIGGILARTTADGPAFYGYDGNGNVTLLTNSAGQDVGHYRYDAFGNTLEAVGVRAAENPYRFSTKELHGPSGLYDYGLRFYSPGMGRWINRDPLSEEGGVNLYGFVDNNPINEIDEYGLLKKPGISFRFWANMAKRGISRDGGTRVAAAVVSLPVAIMAATLAVTAKPAGEKTRRQPTFVFRNMEMGPNKMPKIGNSKSKLGVTTPQTNPQGKSFDLKPNDRGIVSPGLNGMSVSPLPTGVPGRSEPVWALQLGYLPTGLIYIPDPKNINHGFIAPAFPMTIDHYRSLINSTQINWRYVIPLYPK